MRTVFFLAFFFAIASFAGICAAEMPMVSVTQDIAAQGETVQAYITYSAFSASKLSLTDPNGSKVTATFFTAALGNNTHFAYFNLPTTAKEGSYKLQHRERKVVDGQLADIIGEDSFNVTSAESSYAIAPAFIKLEQGTSSFKIQLAHRLGSAITANISVTDTAVNPARNTISLDPGESKFLYADYDYAKLAGDSVMRLEAENRSYEIPLLLAKADEQEKNETIEGNETEPNVTETSQTEPAINHTEIDALKNAISVEGGVKELKMKALQNATISGPIRFTNRYGKALHNVKFEASGGIAGITDFNISSFPVVKPDETMEQFVWINKKRNAEAGEYYGGIIITSDEGAEYAISADIALEEVKAATGPVKPTINITELPNITLPNYSELGGGEKVDKAKSLRIAILLIAVVLILAALFIYKIRPTKGRRKMADYIAEVKMPEKQKKK